MATSTPFFLAPPSCFSKKKLTEHQVISKRPDAVVLPRFFKVPRLLPKFLRQDIQQIISIRISQFLSRSCSMQCVQSAILLLFYQFCLSVCTMPVLCQKERTGLVFLTPPPLQNSNNPAVSWGAKIQVGEKIWQISPFISETVECY